MFNRNNFEAQQALVKEIENGSKFSLRKFLAIVELNAIVGMQA